MELLERTSYLSELQVLLQRAAGGHGQVLFLGGEAGVGKTVLVRAFTEQVPAATRVLTGACDPLSTPRPLGPLLDMSEQLGGDVAAQLAAFAPRHELFKAVLDELANRAPALMIVEDAHWADEATLDLLRYLSRRLRPVSALIVVTFRDDEVGARHPLRRVLGDLATLGEVRRLGLPPLSLGAVTQMAQGAAIDAGELFRLTGGNPFFVTEALALGTEGVPATVRDAVLARTSRLTPDGRAVLDLCAVVGSAIEPVLLELLGVGAPPVAECLDSGVLTSGGGDLHFRHELARQAVLEVMSPVARTEISRRVLAGLRSASMSDNARLAHFAEEAGDREAVLEYAPQAARRAAALGAHREAADQYTRALRFAGHLAPERQAALLDAKSYECYLTGQLGEAIEAAEAATAIWRESGNSLREGDGLRVLARLNWVSGRGREAGELSASATDILETLPESPELAMAYSGRAQLAMLAWEWDEAIEWGSKAIALAERFGETSTLVHALTNVGAAYFQLEDDRGRQDLERSVALARHHGFHDHVSRAYAALGSASCEQYRFAYADRVLDEGIGFCAEHDLDFMGSYLAAWRAISRMYQGQWEEAAAQAGSVLSKSQHSPLPRIVALVALGRVQARRGDPDAAATLEEAAALAVPTGELQRIAPVRAARAEAAWLAGDSAGILREAVDQYANVAAHNHRWLAGELAYWRWRAGELASAPEGVFEPFALQIQGRWKDAAAAWKALGCPYESAVALADSGDEADLRYAHAAFIRLGAAPAVAMVVRRLRELGAERVPRGPRPTTQTNPFHLTNREMEVLTLLAENRGTAEITDILFLSPRTVGHHISSILSKMEAGTRSEAVRMAIRLGMVSPGSDERSDAHGKNERVLSLERP
jgi:DNA-binding CsgD family transcriptional regulator